MKKLQSTFCVFGLCAAILSPNAVRAAVPPALFTIDDSSPAETITVTWSGFINSVLLNSVVYPSAGSLTFNESVINTINFSGMWNSGGLAIAPTYVDFYEDNTLTTISDNLTYSVGTGPGISTFNLTFTSDVEGGAPLLPQVGATTFVEQFDAGGLPLAYEHQYNTLQPLYFSVTSSPEAVPEPSIIALGLLGTFLGIQRWRRHSHTPPLRRPGLVRLRLPLRLRSVACFATLVFLLLGVSARASTYSFDLKGTVGFGLRPGNENPAAWLGGVGYGGEVGSGILFDDVSKILTLEAGWGASNGFSDLSGPATAAHLHATVSAGVASFSENGGVTLDLSPYLNPSATAGGIVGSMPLTFAQESYLFSGRLYMNVHTALYPAGEIRGNLVNPTLVPEPAAGSLLLLGAPALALVRRRSPRLQKI